MIDFKKYIGNQLLNKTLKFYCNCIIPLNFIGKIINVSIENNEYIYTVKSIDTNKIIHIGSNHPNLKIEEI